MGEEISKEKLVIMVSHNEQLVRQYSDKIITIRDGKIDNQKIDEKSTFKTSKMHDSASAGFANATDLADYLVKKGVPFRDAHRVVGQLVTHCLGENKALLDLTLKELQSFHPAFEADVFADLSMTACVEKRRVPGAPAPEMVQASIDHARMKLQE